jgi:hypothetical protein
VEVAADGFSATRADDCSADGTTVIQAAGFRERRSGIYIAQILLELPEVVSKTP